MNLTLTYTYSLDEIEQAAQWVCTQANASKVWLLEGNMGAGKTTLAKAICLALGVTDTVSSPTFSLVNEYRTRAQEPIYHFDFYRINSLREAEDIGTEDYLYSGHLCLVEWSERIAPLLPDHCLIIRIETLPDGRRNLLLIQTNP
ncbi:tRNA threonylcarbamoyladenosine biosynthesis protein TsaE [Flexibacter flexilis DSM 6793]|uniref:tRNA threonylcarbamoyladenosine biosynthesis protein TsaE n=1 Tax=Flexibacter flexilis DSM 6793 TaxID=927664 RepID=A0A1I1K7T5_9BACT|nr:tRNA (adenosine(37)-N6)-threonylcarbamoyltransferase complex ATPase subunit type 1 TsaE [Flexibacter flexilis]SFC53590.1 tRNA threonylcarbamoyladenosine biosynthesis protein TsaE [Flexibacter flexilis DSM 6793]